MKVTLMKTGDGSTTLYVPSLDEHYHSVHGAVTESEHVFIRAGFLSVQKPSLRIFEVGYGTGLNALLTYLFSIRTRREVFYQAIDNDPPGRDTLRGLGYLDAIPGLDPAGVSTIHDAEWNRETSICGHFTLHKIKDDWLTFIPEGSFDLVYYDAFAPRIQPGMWSLALLQKIADCLNPEGVIVTYAASGELKRNLALLGLHVETLPGAPGKKQMTRARKTSSQPVN